MIVILFFPLASERVGVRLPRLLLAEFQELSGVKIMLAAVAQGLHLTRMKLSPSRLFT